MNRDSHERSSALAGGYVPKNWGEYMVNKKAKLQEQFQEDRETEGGHEQISAIFAGVKIHVNGLTKPSGPELKKLMSLHGGLYEQYPDSSVTHIIATNLPEAKFRLLTGKEKILLPEWITDSIRAGKLVPERNYSLIEKMRTASSSTGAQFSMNSFVESKNGKGSEGTLKPKESTHYDDAYDDGEEGDGYGWWMAQKQQISENTKVTDGIEDAVKRGEVSTAKDADFLQNYYKSSRLHHLSTWKAEFQRQLMQQLLEMYKKKESTKTKEQKDHKKDHNSATMLRKRSANVLQENKTEEEEEKEEDDDRADEEPMMKSSSLIHHSDDVAQPDDPPRRIVAHIDMDCFFASVAIRTNPSLAGLPIVISHSSEESTSGSASVSSCNYEARAFGIKNGMSVGKARQLCSNVRIVGYQFSEYEKVSKSVYEVLVQHFETIQAVSCDEAYVELQDCTFSKAEELMTRVRKEIFAQTNCSASAGIGPNMLLARMATKKAKPNGQFCIRPSGLVRFLAEQKVKDLPSVGPAIAYALTQKKITKLADILAIPKEDLQKEFGEKTGERLWFFSRGIDDRELQVFHHRKSVGVDLNWGVRLDTLDDVKKVLGDLAVELSSRMHRAAVRGAHLTCKVKKRKPNAPTPAKWLGHGLVDNFSKSVPLATAIADSASILDQAILLFRSLEIEAKEVRGLGLQMTKLSSLLNPSAIPKSSSTIQKEGGDGKSNQVQASATAQKHSAKKIQQITLSQHVVQHLNEMKQHQQEVTEVANQNQNFVSLPSADEIDAAVMAELPASLQQEIAEAYAAVSESKVTAAAKPAKKRKNGSKKTKAKEKDKEREKVTSTAMLDPLPPPPLEAAPLVPKEKPKKSLTPPKFLTFSTETSSEIRAALRQWMNSVPNPQEVHLELISQYLYFQIENRNLELAQKVLEWMRAIATEEEAATLWNGPFKLVLEKIQAVLQEKYSARFALPIPF